MFKNLIHFFGFFLSVTAAHGFGRHHGRGDAGGSQGADRIRRSAGRYGRGNEEADDAGHGVSHGPEFKGMEEPGGTPIEFQPGSRWMYSASAGLVKNENSLSMSRKVYFAGGGGLVSTVDDYSHFAQMLANGGELNGLRLLSPRTVKLMGSAHIRSTLPGRRGGITGSRMEDIVAVMQAIVK